MKTFARRRTARGGCLVKLLVFFVFMGAALALAWMLFLPVIFTQQIRRRTGFDADVSSFALNPCTGRIAVRGLVITNPPTFPVPDCLQLRAFEANADVWSCFGEKLIIDELTLDVRLLTLVKRADGHSNAEVFQGNLAGPVPAPPSAKSHVLVRKLHLRFDTLVLADHTERKPRVREYRLNFDQTFLNISDPKQLLVPGVMRSLMTNDLAGGLGQFLPGDLGKLLTESARTGQSLLKSAERKAADTFHGFLDKLEEMRKP